MPTTTGSPAQIVSPPRVGPLGVDQLDLVQLDLDHPGIEPGRRVGVESRKIEPGKVAPTGADAVGVGQPPARDDQPTPRAAHGAPRPSNVAARPAGVAAQPATRAANRFPGGPAAVLPVNGRQELAMPAHAFPHRTPRELVTLGRRGLEEAAGIRPDGLRYATAHLAALRAAAAVLAARATPAPGRRGRLTNVWALLVMVAPELREWATYFSAGAAKRAAAEAGIPRVVTAREADDLLRAAEQFIAVVEITLGLSYQPMLDSSAGKGRLAS